MSPILLKLFSTLDKVSSYYDGKSNIEDLKENLNAGLESHGDVLTRILNEIDRNLSPLKGDKIEDRLYVGCFCNVVLQEIHNQFILEAPSTLEDDNFNSNNPRPPSNILSVKQYKLIDIAVKVVLFWPVLGCIDGEDAALYLKVAVAKSKWRIAGHVLSIPDHIRHSMMVNVMDCVMNLFKHKILGEHLQRNISSEITCVLLHLGFHLPFIKSHPTEVERCRKHLEDLMEVVDQNTFIQHILSYLGVFPPSGRLWKVCEMNLVTRFLFEENGVRNVLYAGLNMGDSTNWKYCDALASLLANRKYKDIHHFYATIGRQLYELLLRHESLTNEFNRVLALMLHKLTDRSSTLTAQHIMNKLIEPLVAVTIKSSSEYNNEEASRCVVLLHKIMIEVCPPSQNLCTLITPVICPLFVVSNLPPTCPFKTSAQQLLIRYLTLLETESVITSLLVLSGLESRDHIPPLKSFIELKANVSPGFQIEETHKNPEELLKYHEETSINIIQLLESLRSSIVVIEFIKEVTKRLNFKITPQISRESSNYLLTDQDMYDEEVNVMHVMTICSSLLCGVAENASLIDNLFNDLLEALPIIINLFKVSCDKSEDISLSKIQDVMLLNTVMLVLSYLQNRMSTEQMVSSDWTAISSLLPHINAAENTTSDPAILMFIEQLKNIVLTHGVITTEKLKPESNIDNKDIDTNEMITEYKKAIEDLCSPLIPLKGHALIELGKMILNRKEVALKNKNKLLSIFEHNIKHEDSYIYLPAVQGLVYLCDAFPKKVLPQIITELNNNQRSHEDRIKLAETIGKVANRLGETVPHHRAVFLQGLLSSIEENEGLLRAACISAFGDVCEELNWSIKPIIHQTLLLFANLLNCEKIPEVRRATVMCITLMLRGLQTDAIKVLQDVLRDIYRSLRLLASNDHDDVVRVHAQVALQEIDDIMRQFLQPKMHTTKKIFVSEVPPNFFD